MPISRKTLNGKLKVSLFFRYFTNFFRSNSIFYLIPTYIHFYLFFIWINNFFVTYCATTPFHQSSDFLIRPRKQCSGSLPVFRPRLVFLYNFFCFIFCCFSRFFPEKGGSRISHRAEKKLASPRAGKQIWVKFIRHRWFRIPTFDLRTWATKGRVIHKYYIYLFFNIQTC